MTRKNLEKKVLKAVRFYVPQQDRDSVTLESTLAGDLCFDSMDRVELALSLEKEFSFKEKDVVWEQLLQSPEVSVNDVCDFVERKM